MNIADYAKILLEEEPAKEVIRRVQLRNFKQFCDGDAVQQDEARQLQKALERFYEELQAIVNETVLKEHHSGERK